MDNEQDIIEQTDNSDNSESVEKVEQTPEEHFSEKMGEILSKSDSEEITEQDDKEDSFSEGTSDEEDSKETDYSQLTSSTGLSKEILAQIEKEAPDLIESIKAELNNTKKEQKEQQEPDEKDVVKSKEKLFEELKVDIDPDMAGIDVKNAIDSTIAKVNELGKRLEQETLKLQQERENIYQHKIDSEFDKYAKDVPDIGKSNSITEKQYKTRIELFRHAGITAAMRNIPIEKAIEVEINKYKNQDGEKVAQQKLLDKLAKQKKHFTQPPTRRHSDLASRKFDSEEERKEAIMAEAYKKAGIEL